MPISAKITGTFVDFGVEFGTLAPRYPAAMLDPDFWRRELADMKAAGIEDVILARIMELGRTHYHSALFQEWESADHVDRIMTAATEQRMKVWLGGHLNLAFWDRNWEYGHFLGRQRCGKERYQEFCDWNRH